MAKTNQNKDGYSQQKVEICNTSTSYVILSLEILAAIENCQYSRMRILHMNCQILVNIL